MFNGGSFDDEGGRWDQTFAKNEYRRDGKHLFGDDDAKQTNATTPSKTPRRQGRKGN